MAILVDNETRLVVQGITGREGTFHGKQAAAYGTNVVGGTSPGKGNQRGDIHYRFVIDVPRDLSAEQQEAVETLSKSNGNPRERILKGVPT